MGSLLQILAAVDENFCKSGHDKDGKDKLQRCMVAMEVHCFWLFQRFRLAMVRRLPGINGRCVCVIRGG